MKYLLLLFCSLITPFLFAQGFSAVGARSAAMGNSSVCLDDVWAYHQNPGALASVRQVSAGIWYEARFLMKELQTEAIAAAIPLKTGVLSAGGQLFGYSQFRSTRAGIGYSLQLGAKFSAAVQVNGQQISIAGG